MLKKNLVIFILILSFVLLIFCYPKNNEYYIKNIVSPVEFITSENNLIKLQGYDFFDDKYSEKNKILAQKYNLTEDEAFIVGNLTKHWTIKTLFNRKIKYINDEVIFYKYSYNSKFEQSPFCIKNDEIVNEIEFLKKLNSIRKTKFVLYDLDTEKVFDINKSNAESIKNFVVIRKNNFTKNKKLEKIDIKPVKNIYEKGNIKLIISDMTKNLKPSKYCSDEVCKEILFNINKAKKSIDMAIYGYSEVYEIEKAIKNALSRGVNVRLVYDVDKDGNNIYQNTFDLASIIIQNKNDKNSNDVYKTMHNKFYIFDDEIVITGSANLSHTDMSGFNSNNIIRIKSFDIAKIYKNEFNQMFDGKFHTEKISVEKPNVENIKVYFSPQDKSIINGILPLIKTAKKYIYIPAFVITNKEFTQELISAKSRGVDVKIILDAVSASNIHSKYKELRASGISLKIENYAGKMHSKTILIDDEYLIMGSMNFSNSGQNKNDENIIILKNSDLTKFYKEFFIYQWNKIPDKWLKYVPKAEGIDSIGSCSDGIDNDYDGLIDELDSACKK